MMRSKMTVYFLLLVCFLPLFCLNSTFCQQTVGEDPRSALEKQEAVPQAEDEVEKIIPSPKNIKEGIAIYMFVGWMWLSIFVLIYILRLKIKEVDRLYHLRFFSTKKK